MLLYLDTSALVKRYVRESHSDEILTRWRSADYIATSFVAYAEALTAFHRKKREANVPLDLFARLIAQFHGDWEALIRVEVNAELEPYVLDLLERHPLRGFDAIHLASAMALHQRVHQQAKEDLVFACFDEKLAGAARAEGMLVYPS